MPFPLNFTWGAATASYQIEGAALEDGKGASIWDVFTRKKGAIYQGHHGDVACDHYHRLDEDLRIMQDIGLKAYRFSFSWPRILPDSRGTVNEKGLAFYDRLVDGLLDAGIKPYATLFHWDYPRELYIRGGWLNPDSPEWFAEYTGLLVDHFSDRIQNWITLNEPQCFVNAGHFKGAHAPGVKLPLSDLLSICHHVLLAHGRAVETIRAASVLPKPRIGLSSCAIPFFPATDSAADIEAARKRMFAVQKRDLWNLSWYLDPIFKGEYPADGLALFKKDMPAVSEEDMRTISAPLDFFGMNIYGGSMVRASKSGNPEVMEMPPGYPRTAFNWPVQPDCMHWALRFFYDRYHKPIVITENGMSGTDWVMLDGQVHDPQRIDMLQRYLRAVEEAINRGVPVEGFFLWTLLDNFEWAAGYSERFGIVHVDFETQKRTLKDSARWYSEVIATNGGNLRP